MSDMQFFDEIPIHRENTLRQLLARFQTVKEGLPELVKNSKDQYARLNVTEQRDRAIIVLADSRRRSLAVLDFAGARAADLSRWAIWSEPQPDRAGMPTDIEAVL